MGRYVTNYGVRTHSGVRGHFTAETTRLIAMAAMMVVKLHHFGSLSIPIHEIAWSSQLS